MPQIPTAARANPRWSHSPVALPAHWAKPDIPEDPGEFLGGRAEHDHNEARRQVYRDGCSPFHLDAPFRRCTRPASRILLAMRSPERDEELQQFSSTAGPSRAGCCRRVQALHHGDDTGGGVTLLRDGQLCIHACRVVAGKVTDQLVIARSKTQRDPADSSGVDAVSST